MVAKKKTKAEPKYNTYQFAVILTVKANNSFIAKRRAYNMVEDIKNQCLIGNDELDLQFSYELDNDGQRVLYLPPLDKT